MRTITEFKKISVTKEVYDRIIKDKIHFENVIGGGAWSISDTITEDLKILSPNYEAKIDLTMEDLKND